MTNRFINPVPQFLDASGNPIVSGEVNFYENGTTIRKDTYSDINKSVNNLNANPLKLTADGRIPNVFYDGTARVIVTHNAGAGRVQLFDKDGVGDAGSGSAFDVWNSVVEYEDNALVEASDGEYYRSLQSINLGNDPTTSPTFWENVAFLRTWNANVTYGLGAGGVVASDGKIYRSLQASNVNKDPISEPTWWDINNPFDQSLDTTDSPTFVNLSIDSMGKNWTNAGRTIADLGNVTTVDINGGTVDGTIIGGATPAAATVTTVIANTSVSTDVIAEKTAAAGVTIDGVLLKDGGALLTAVADLSAAGIYLGGTAAANILDYYEEGTFTPVYNTTNADLTGVTYSSQLGRYIRIGKMVYCSIYLATADAVSAAGTGNLVITGLPFTSQSAARTVATTVCGRFINIPTQSYVTAGTTRLELKKDWLTAATVADLTKIASTNYNVSELQFCYEVA